MDVAGRLYNFDPIDLQQTTPNAKRKKHKPPGHEKEFISGKRKYKQSKYARP